MDLEPVAAMPEKEKIVLAVSHPEVRLWIGIRLMFLPKTFHVL